ncbi:amidohydrolase [Corynebacterium sp. zg254]|uniref:Amidohydrolase n=1 Tax=Corynebacterium zhongnanshanii TaxID=2768834 RepID=A0ABQ6VET5_9CORY|nr:MULTISPECIES: amidohydrolase [Corynebacterium]KAB3522941.1 amidohydrolase [Corynebacterium zhongnanshanii]MCR5913980.1 amidohydrolase [Corynebacterium sp. zg254]
MSALSVSAFVTEWLANHEPEVIEWRRHLHRNPELSHHETQTTQFIVDTLSAAGLDPVVLPHKGVRVDVGPATGPIIAFRGDIDALPVFEETGLEFASQKPGVMHACGHDMHTAIVLALAVALAQLTQRYGADALGVRVRCIFQPAEEVMDGGAVDAIASGVLEGVTQIFAVHCEPKLRTGEIGVRTGAITSASDVVEIVLRGHGGHTSRPHMTADLGYAAGLLLTQLPGMVGRTVDPRSGTVVAFGSINGGKTFNAIPREIRLLGTVRTMQTSVWRKSEDMIRSLVEQIVAPTGADVEVIYTKGVPPVNNSDVATALLAQAVNQIDPLALKEASQSSGGEDFSWYLEEVSGSMARLGCWDGTGEHRPDLHQPDIVFDERALAIGVRLFASTLDQCVSGLSISDA